MFRRMMPSLAMIAALLASIFVGVGLVPSHVLAAPVGVVEFLAADQSITTCDTVTGGPEPELMTLRVPGPRVFKSADFHASSPRTRQPIRVTVRLVTVAANGTRTLGPAVSVISGKAGFASAPLVVGPLEFGVPIGPRTNVVYTIEWLDAFGLSVLGTAERVNPWPFPLSIRGVTFGLSRPECWPAVSHTVGLSTGVGTVNQRVVLTLMYARVSKPGQEGNGTILTWDGQPLPTTTVSSGVATVDEAFNVPASVAGNHVIRATRSDGAVVSTNFRVVPRIKITPSLAARDSIVDVSLRGYGRGEIVDIRWKRGASFVTLATVTTSNTGSANVALRVPTFAPDGLQAVRGDGTVNRAQTNAFEVSGGPFVAAKPVKTATPSPTQTPTATPEVSVTETVEATAEPTATATETAVATDEAQPTATEIASPESEVTDVPLPTIEPTLEVTVPAGEETVVAPEATVESTAEEQPVT